MVQPVSYDPGTHPYARTMVPPPPSGYFQPPAGPYGPPSAPGVPMNVGPEAPVSAFPRISPFEHQFQQHRVEKDGLWKFRSSNQGKRHFFSMEALFGRYRRPGSTVLGNNDSVSYLHMMEDELILATDEEYYDQFNDNTGLNFFDRTTYDVVPNMNAPGARIRWGWLNDDDSGIELTGWWIAQADSVWSADIRSTHKSNPANQAVFDILLSPPDYIFTPIPGYTVQDIGAILQEELKNLASLPLDDGTIDGVSVPYDIDFRIKTISQSWGTNLTWLSTPFVDKKNLKIRGLAGARYMQVREGFSFYGRDSGLVYAEGTTVAATQPDLKVVSLPTGTDENQDGIIDNTGFSEDESSGNTSTTTTVFFLGVNDPVTSYVNNTVDTHLAGPEIGFQFDLGGDKFKIWGQTKFGIMANRSKIKLNGDNIGMITRDDPTDPDRPQALITPTAADPNPNQFSDYQTHTHVSPLFEQSIFAEMNLFDKVPVLKRMKLLEEAKLKVGYTYIVAGEVTRPYESILWTGMPTRGLFPSIDVKREKWSVGTWSVGLDWNY
ncbi:hypothetical protein [Gimesia sp.]|uniref:hypothetical protein n=3 Tax=Gimesia TaxID=1649453 RepID=UPI0025BF54C7|nr:hypothetical protein [Gimesia sp.]